MPNPENPSNPFITDHPAQLSAVEPITPTAETNVRIVPTPGRQARNEGYDYHRGGLPYSQPYDSHDYT